MLPIAELFMGLEDAKSYNVRGKREQLNAVFVRNRFLEEILYPEKYFIIGDKGTGKTAYAVYLSNNTETRNGVVFDCDLKYIEETDYSRFMRLKESEHINFSTYTDIWRFILLMLVCQQIDYDKKQRRAKEMNRIKDALERCERQKFEPEIRIVLDHMTDSGYCAGLQTSILGIESHRNSTVNFSDSKFKFPLMELENELKKALNVKLQKNLILFIDGIDLRPSEVDYNEYNACIKGLARAAWSLNTDFFANIKDSDGLIKIVLLLRPDIFNNVEFHNSSCKVRDNSVFMDWRTDYNSYRNSDLFMLCEKLLSYKQDLSTLPKTTESVWDHYLPWTMPSTKPDKRDNDESFIDILRLTYSRPRDMIAILRFLQDAYLRDRNRKDDQFQLRYLNNDKFRENLSEYLLSSVIDHMSYYYSRQEIELFKTFFNFLDGKPVFTYDEYELAYNNYLDYLTSPGTASINVFVDDPRSFLNLLYDCNIIAYIEQVDDQKLWRWCYRERNITSPNPQVKISPGVTYFIHEGLRKALKLKRGRY